VLLSAIPVPDPDQARATRPAEVMLRDDGGGCSFFNRCVEAEGKCREGVPELREVSPGHWVACVKSHKA
jgi:oligopeptide/dipeptide ABC transporter ATP-binding protein